MQKTIRTFLFSISIFATAIIVVVLVRSLFYSPQADITVPSVVPIATAQSNPSSTQTRAVLAPVVVTADTPVHISIPALKLATDIQQVGLTGAGRMAVPTNFSSVGWYKYGAVPGQEGSAVIAGHVNNGLALPAVFANLDKLQAGDDIYITMGDGTILHFMMTSSQTYDKDAPTTDVFNGTGKLLRLITCTGDWLPLQRTHNQRLVVTAVLQP